MDAKIEAVRWKWKAYLDLLRAIDNLLTAAGTPRVINVEERERLVAEIAEMDKQLEAGYTDYRAIKKTT